MDHQILCIRRSARVNPQERITHIGGRNHDGSCWEIPQQAVIDGIDAGQWTFFVEIQKRRLPVLVAVGRSGIRYLKTAVDGEEPDTLLALPECSSRNACNESALHRKPDDA